MPVPRKKSCAQCRRAKSRCSLTSPICSRCTSKRLKCDYSEALESASNLDGRNALWQNRSVTAALSPLRGSTPVGDLVGERATVSNVFEFNMPGLGGDVELFPEFDWNSQSPGIFGNQDLGMNFHTEGDLTSSSTASSTLLLPRSSNSEIDIEDLEESHAIFEDLFISWKVTCPWPDPSKVPKRFQQLLSKRTMKTLPETLSANHVYSTLVTYPALLNTGSLPPFIHPTVQSIEGYSSIHTLLPEPLANCSSFVAMFLSKTPTSTPFVLRTLQNEIERLRNEYRQIDRRGKLAAIQALAIYTILVSSEQQRSLALSLGLLVSMGGLVADMQESLSSWEAEHDGIYYDWEEWIFYESKVRTWTVLWLLQNVIDTDLGVTIKSRCAHYHMDDTPLPCPKQLWEVTSKREWEQHYQSYLTSRRSHGTIKTGDLRSTQRARDAPIKEAVKEDLISWSSNVDSLGALFLVHVR
ncbi:hypothetical protein ACMFMG_010317 [Clarireedia jacksonii]